MTVASKSKLVILTGFVFLLIAGGFSFFLVRKNIQTSVESDLEYAVNIASASIDDTTLSHLTVTAADNKNEAYQRLRERLMQVGTVLKEKNIRGIYVMRVQGKEIRFVVDSAPKSDPWHSEPGVLYKEPPPAVFEVNQSDHVRFVGPYTDEYGSFYSIFTSRTSEDLVFIIGGDVDTKIYNMLMAQRSWPPIALFVSILLAYGITSLTIYFRIIHKQHQLERENERRRHIEEREAMFMNIGDGVVVCDASGKIVFVNTYAHKAIGVSREACLGKDYRVHWAMVDADGSLLPDDKQPIKAYIRNPRAPVFKIAEHSYLRRANGTVFPVILSLTLVKDAGKPSLYILTFRDFTKETELDQIKTDFISMATHQLKTPLTALKWIVENLTDSKAKRSKEDREALAELSEVVSHMDELVRSLLDVTRIETGRLAVEPQMTDLEKLVGTAMQEIARHAEEKKQKIRVHVETTVPQVMADPHLIQEVFKNLLTNAVKYSPKATEILVRIELQGKNIVASVHDSGYGIPPAEQKRVFTKFFRGSNIMRMDEEGTGLGLYLTKQFVEASGGKIWFESKPGSGTTFFFSLPSGIQTKKKTSTTSGV